MLTPRVPVAREGYPFIGFAAFCTLTAALLGFTIPALILLATTTFILCFFRDPERFTPPLENALISPADGKVLFVKQVDDDKFTGGRACKISIFMNIFNVHVNRIPISSTVEKVIYTPGKFYSADSEKGALQNEYCATILTTANGSTIACVQVAGLIARRIVCWLEASDSVTCGRRFGLIRFGSRVDLYLPPDTDISVQPGQKVRAGETVLGHLL
ncbi:MAG: phosphatidylserine decarboxylase family protein [Deltaproteobacteria bacterium]|nr:phosphatidylserine decarboxylase family protein [Deltaproteobacteria bacterium]MBW2658195.1 phosphatidylserine decarboxylase family protein [Deltaproteobacteria bacterium]